MQGLGLRFKGLGFRDEGRVAGVGFRVGGLGNLATNQQSMMWGSTCLGGA